MHYQKICVSLVATSLVACGAPSANLSETENDPKEEVQSVSIDELISQADLWDTNLTYGLRPDPDSTGLERGRQVYEQNCAICHADGVGMAGTDSLRRRYQMIGETELDPILANRTDLYPEFIESVVRNGVKSMPYFRKTEVSDEDLQLVSMYLTRNNPEEGG